MKQLSDIRLYLILTWAQAEAEDGHWDDTGVGLYYQSELNEIILQAKIEIANRGFTEREFQKKYVEMFREAPRGHYISH